MTVAVQNAIAAPYEVMEPSLLAKQPVTKDPRPQAEPEWWNTVFSHLEARLGSLRTWRYSWWSTWSRLAEFFLPRRYTWLVVANRMSRGSYLNDAIIDSTGTLAMQVCS